MIKDYLESTNLKLDANWKDIRKLVQDANKEDLLGVCTYLYWSGVVDKYASETLKKIYVLGFYTGAPIQIFKDLETVQYNKTADEFDLVFPYPAYINKDIKVVEKILSRTREMTKGKILKIIIETAVLRSLPDMEEKFKEVIGFCEEAGADIIKTNTGMYPRKGTLVEDVRLIQACTKLPIKCSGGIRDYKSAKELVDLGVTRIGTSNALQIIGEENNES